MELKTVKKPNGKSETKIVTVLQLNANKVDKPKTVNKKHHIDETLNISIHMFILSELLDIESTKQPLAINIMSSQKPLRKYDNFLCFYAILMHFIHQTINWCS